jgi:phosphate transport system protein
MSDKTQLETHLQKDIDTIKSKIQEMASLAENALNRSFFAFLNKNGQLAYSVILLDQKIDKLEKEIDQLCLEFLIRQHPAASLLRFVYASIKVNLELERIGDYAESVARRSLVVNSLNIDLDFSQFEAINKTSVSMLNNSIQAFINQDKDLAATTMLEQREVSRLRDKINDDLFLLASSKKIPITALTPLQTIARRLERVADQSKNICEETLYMCTGENIKHLKTKTFKVLFVDDNNAHTSQIAEAIGNALNQENFVFSSAGITSKNIADSTIKLLKDKGHDTSNNISKLVENIPNLKNYQVIIALSEASQKVSPSPPTKTISINWELDKILDDPNATYDFLEKNINDLVQAILGEESWKN